MPITGEFASAIPYVYAKLILPRLYLVYEFYFLVDTGADSTVVMPRDAKSMGIDYLQLRGDIASIGVGGTVHSFHEPALLVFVDSENVEYTYKLDIRFMEDTVISRQLPSLLGRDVLNRWRIVYDPEIEGLVASVRSADSTRTLNPRS
jgi:predicted aspartyl protease